MPSAIGSVIGAGASIYGASEAADASKHATDTAYKVQQQIRSDVQPYNDAGVAAINQISNPNSILQNFTTSPGYQFRMDQGMNQVLQNKAVNGLLGSGSALSGLEDYAQGAASSEYNNWFNNELNVAKTGISGEGLAAGAANQQQSAIMTNGANQGNADIATANGVGSLAGSLQSLFNQYGSGSSGGSTGGTSSYAPSAADSASGAIS